MSWVSQKQIDDYKNAESTAFIESVLSTWPVDPNAPKMDHIEDRLDPLENCFIRICALYGVDGKAFCGTGINNGNTKF